MIRTIEATIDETGTVRLLEGVDLPAPRRALVMILDEESGPGRKVSAGTPGRDLLRFAGRIDTDSAAEMMQAIEEDCNKVDPGAW